jgi:hypothetical protein
VNKLLIFVVGVGVGAGGLYLLTKIAFRSG